MGNVVSKGVVLAGRRTTYSETITRIDVFRS
jgi:hypothetical protein